MKEKKESKISKSEKKEIAIDLSNISEKDLYDLMAALASVLDLTEDERELNSKQFNDKNGPVLYFATMNFIKNKSKTLYKKAQMLEKIYIRYSESSNKKDIDSLLCGFIDLSKSNVSLKIKKVIFRDMEKEFIRLL